MIKVQTVTIEDVKWDCYYLDEGTSSIVLTLNKHNMPHLFLSGGVGSISYVALPSRFSEILHLYHSFKGSMPFTEFLDKVLT